MLVSPEPESEPEQEEDAPSKRSSSYPVSKYVNIYTWGVRDSVGEWVVVKDHPWRATYDAKNLTSRESLEIYERHPDAYQLIDGCDSWACLDDTPEIFVVKKEKTNVPAPKSVPGTGPDSDGSGDVEEVRTPVEDSAGGDD